VDDYFLSGRMHAMIGIGGYCLGVRGGGARANGTPLELWKCHFQANQRFHLSADGRIKRVESGKCLIALAAKNGAPLALTRCMNTPDEIYNIRHETLRPAGIGSSEPDLAVDPALSHPKADCLVVTGLPTDLSYLLLE
jgi:hypothetical protein